jgi:hypothetical protein
MIPMPPDPIPLEQVRESQSRMHLILEDEVVSILWLTDDELAKLDESILATATQQEKHMKGNIPATPYP